MRAYLPVVVSVLLGAVVGAVLFLLPVARQAARPSGAPAPQVTRQAPVGAVTPKPAPVPTRRAASPSPAAVLPPPTPAPVALPLASLPPDSAGGDVAADTLATARALVAAGRLREGQDEYVQVLLIAPDHDAAWRELVAVRRRLAGDDSALLRRQAAAYRRAIARGEETEEHYTVSAMRILAQASVLAAQEIEGGTLPSPRGLGPSSIVLQVTPGPRPAVTATAAARPVVVPTPRARATRRPTPRPTARVVQTAVPVTPKPTALPPTPRPTPGVPLDVNEPFLIIRVGPISTAARASEVAAELTISGYAPQVSRVEGTSTYLVTLGPYRRSVVEAIVKLVRSRFPGVSVSVVAAP